MLYTPQPRSIREGPPDITPQPNLGPKPTNPETWKVNAMGTAVLLQAGSGLQVTMSIS